jgi:hypothetical protein
MVVLARAAGMPARLVVGYAGGLPDPVNVRYLVTEANAHAWPEIYFPGYGWIEFEPTAARPPWERRAEPVLPSGLGWESSPPTFVTATSPAVASTRWGWGIVAGLAGLALTGTVWWTADLWWLRHTPPAATVARLYRRLQRYGVRLALPIMVGATPFEFSDVLIAQINHLAQPSRWGARLLAPASREIEQLTGLYVAGIYSGHKFGEIEQSHAVQSWRRLWWRLGLMVMRSSWEHLFK